MTEENNWTSEGAVEITHDVGLHARPSVKLTKLAKRFSARIEIAADSEGPWIDAKSIVKVTPKSSQKDPNVIQGHPRMPKVLPE